MERRNPDVQHEVDFPRKGLPDTPVVVDHARRMASLAASRADDEVTRPSETRWAVDMDLLGGRKTKWHAEQSESSEHHRWADSL
jgi:hypothetical protein